MQNSVFVRLRPADPELLACADDPEDNAIVCWCSPDDGDGPRPDEDGTVLVGTGEKISTAKKSSRLFLDRGSVLEEHRFPRVFAPVSTNLDVFSEINPGGRVVTSVCDGINETVFSYGQTGSGKTHAIFGSEEELGLLHLFIRGIFNAVGGGKVEVRVGVEGAVLSDRSIMEACKLLTYLLKRIGGGHGFGVVLTWC